MAFKSVRFKFEIALKFKLEITPNIKQKKLNMNTFNYDFTVKWNMLFTKIGKYNNIERNSLVPWPKTWVFMSMDFISNYHLTADIVTSGICIKQSEVSHLIMYFKYWENNSIKKISVSVFSDQTKHGWYSAIPAVERFLGTLHNTFRNKGVDVTLWNVWSDRGPKDFWTCPFMVYMSDTVRYTKVC